MNAPRLELGATGVLALVGIGLAGLVVWRVYKTGDQVATAAADLVRTDLNPANPGNVVNRAVESLGQLVTGDDAWSLGDQVYDWTHTDQTDPTRNTAIAAINPADQDNVINRGLTSIGRSISGDSTWTLGGWIYDVTH